MSAPVLLFLGLVATIAFAIVAKRLMLPYPIVFVVAGTALAFVPGLPAVTINPSTIFLAVLPPLLFSAGWNTDWLLFRRNLRPILQLAIGLVVVSTLAAAAVAHALLPALGWAGAIVLGAIVSPTDAVAAIGIFERFAVPRRIIAIIDGEGLVNDATALVIYGYALAAASTGLFSLREGLLSFVVVSIGGILAGLAVAWAADLAARLLRRYQLGDELIDSLTIIGAAYAAYLGGQALHVSGVLSTVVAGIMISRRSSKLYSPQTRLLGGSFWTLWVFALNAYVFLAIGLQMRALIASGTPVLKLLPAALAVSLTLIVVRLAWVYPTAVIARWIPAVRKFDPLPPWTQLTVIGWTGMRGIVSLAAALAIPYLADNGAPFPGREAIIFVTFVVIVVTLVGQGLTLLPLLRLLKVTEESGDGQRRELAVRIAALQAGLKKIDRMTEHHTKPHEREVLKRLRDEYTQRIDHLKHHATPGDQGETPESHFDHQAQAESIRAERGEIARLRDAGEIPDDIFRTIQYDLDLAEARLF